MHQFMILGIGQLLDLLKIISNVAIMETDATATQIYDYGDVNVISQQITANVMILNGFDLSQLIQSLTEKIQVLEQIVLEAK